MKATFKAPRATSVAGHTSTAVISIAITFLAISSQCLLISSDQLAPLPENLSPASRVIFSDPFQDEYQGTWQSANSRYWAMQSFHRGDGRNPAPRLLIGNARGKLTGVVSGPFVSFDWEKSGFRRLGPIRFDSDGQWCIMSEPVENEYHFVVSGMLAGVLPQKPLAWGLSSVGGSWWYAYPDSGSPPTLIFNGNVATQGNFVSFPRTIERLLSPDGKRIVFAAGRDKGYFDLIVDQKIVTREFDKLIDVAWSPDSMRVAAIIQRSGGIQIILDGKMLGPEHKMFKIEFFGGSSGFAVGSFPLSRRHDRRRPLHRSAPSSGTLVHQPSGCGREG